MMIKALVFDMDGLIFDSERIVQRTWEAAGDEMGMPHLGEHIYNTIGFNLASRTKYFKENVKEDFPMEEFSQRTRMKFREIVDAEGLTVKKGARELILFAKNAGYRLAVATSSRREHATNMFREANLYEYFDGFVFGDMVQHAKPDPEIYLTACQIIGVEPKCAIALEDAPSGIRAATAAGMRTIMVPDLVQPSEEISKMLWHQVTSLEEVITLLENGED
ncbi:MAG: HAD family phosphatase [Lachnospiraceae bacterium]